MVRKHLDLVKYTITYHWWFWAETDTGRGTIIDGIKCKDGNNKERDKTMSELCEKGQIEHEERERERARDEQSDQQKSN